MGAIAGWFDGKKSIIGILSGIATFVLVVTQALQDGFQFSDVEVILGGFAVLMTAIGLAHKAEKIMTALKK